MKKLLCVVFATAAMAWMSAVPASALTCSAGCFTVPSPLVLTGFDDSGTFGDVTVPTASLDDKFEFQLVPPPGTWSSITNAIISGNHVIADLTLSIWSCTDLGCGTASQLALNSTPIVDASGQHIGVTADGLTSGYYFIMITGSSAPPHTTFVGNINVSATPLPGALPLFVSGLGALGFAGWCKRKKAKLAA